MVDDGGANGELTVEGGAGRRNDAGQLQSEHDVGVHLVSVLATVTKANNVERDGRE